MDVLENIPILHRGRVARISSQDKRPLVFALPVGPQVHVGYFLGVGGPPGRPCLLAAGTANLHHAGALGFDHRNMMANRPR
jgi:hypothetical protein